MQKNKITQFNLSPTFTVDQAVLYMLCHLHDYQHFLGLTDTYFSLQDHLHDRWEKVNRARYDATLGTQPIKNLNDISPEKIKLFEKIFEDTKEDFDELQILLIRAKDYRQLISHDVSKARRGKSTWLVIDEIETARTGQIHINRDSFLEWFEGLELDREPPEIPNSPHSMHEGPHEKALTKTAAKNLHITLGLLVKLFAESDANNLKHGQKPNVKRIAERIAHHATELSHNTKVTGQSAESIKNRLEVALYAIESET